MITKRLRPGALYNDILSGGYLMPKKEKFGMDDFKALVKEGWGRIDARYIVICNAIHYHSEDTMEREMFRDKFVLDCAKKDALDERKAEAKKAKECDKLTEKALMLYCTERGIAATETLHCLMRTAVHGLIESKGLEVTRKMVNGGAVKP